MSDIVAALWAAAAVLFALRSHRGDAWAAAAGVAFGMAVLVRPTNALLLLPSWSPPPAPEGAAAFRARRTPVRRRLRASGIGRRMETPLDRLLGSARHGAGGVQLPAAIRALLLLDRRPALAARAPRMAAARWRSRGSRRERRACSSLSGLRPSFSSTVSGDPTDIWWYTRYLIPALPALILAFLLCAARAGAPDPGRRPDRLEEAPRARVARPDRDRRDVRVRRFEQRYRPIGASRGQVVFPEASRAIAARAAGGTCAGRIGMEFSGALRFYTDLTPCGGTVLNAEDFAQIRLRAGRRAALSRSSPYFFLRRSRWRSPHVPGRVEVSRRTCAAREPLGAAASLSGGGAAQRPGCVGRRSVATASGGGVPPSR